MVNGTKRVHRMFAESGTQTLTPPSSRTHRLTTYRGNVFIGRSLTSIQQIKFIAITLLLTYAQVTQSNDISWVSAAHIDTLNKANIKVGALFREPYEYSDERPHYYGSFDYADLEVGLEGIKVSLGSGSSIGHGVDRIGLSYAHLLSQDLFGFETVISQMAMSVKFGYYLGLEDTKNRWLLGLGFGF